MIKTLNKTLINLSASYQEQIFKIFDCKFTFTDTVPYVIEHYVKVINTDIQLSLTVQSM